MKEILMFRKITRRPPTGDGMGDRPRLRAAAANCIAALLLLGGCATTDAGKPMTAEEERELIDEIEALAHRAGKLNDDGRVDIIYERDGETATAIVTPVTACEVGVALVEDKQPNAFADGRNVYLTTGLYLTGADVDLQIVVAHLLAHILKGHVAAEQTRRAVGAAADVGVTVAVNTLLVLGAIGAGLGGEDVSNLDMPWFHTGGFFRELAGRMFSHREEREADELSLAMLERAGVPPLAVVDFWRDLAMDPGDLVAFTERHPINAERLERLDAALAEALDERESPQPFESR